MSEIDRIVEQSEDLPEAVAANTKALVDATRTRCPAPDDIGEGYWPTLRLCWSPPAGDAVEVEVFADRFELYLMRDRHTAIRHFEHVTGDPVSPALLATLAEHLPQS